MSANRNKSAGGIGMGQMPGLKIGERGEMEGFRRKPSNVEGVKAVNIYDTTTNVHILNVLSK